MGISITPLREAVRRLRGEGWIVLDTHRNARVAALDHAEARQVLEARRAVEPVAVASHNPVVIRILDDQWDKSDRYRRVGLHSGDCVGQFLDPTT